jgi:hypothetical protein
MSILVLQVLGKVGKGKTKKKLENKRKNNFISLAPPWHSMV